MLNSFDKNNKHHFEKLKKIMLSEKKNCSDFPRCDVRYDFLIKRSSVRPYIQLFVGGLMFYLNYLCFLANRGFQHILCGVFCFVFLPLVSSVLNVASFS